MRKWVFGGVLALALYALLEGSAALGLFILKQARGLEYSPILVDRLTVEQRTVLEDLVAGRAEYVTFSPALGWAIKPAGTFRDLYRANSQGIRANQEYDLAPPRSRVRIATFGDSFTHGDEVRNINTWQALLQAADSGFEVMNFGMSAYGVDQAFLKYQLEGARYRPDIVFIGFMSENIRRHVNVWRPFYAPGARLPMAKPRFGLDGDSLVLWENPIRDLAGYRDILAAPARVLPTLGGHDYYFHTAWRETPIDLLPSVRLYRLARTELTNQATAITRDGFYNEESEAFRVTARIFDAFVDRVRRDGSTPVILVYPHPDDILRYRDQGTEQYRPLLEQFDRRGYPYIDLVQAFQHEGKDLSVRELAPSHYSARGNRAVAEHILAYLRSRNLTDARAIRRNP